MQTKEIRVFLFIPVFFASCASYNYYKPDPPGYVANVSNINTTKNNYELNNTFLVGSNGLENQSTFSLKKGHAIQLNTFLGESVFNEVGYSFRFPITEEKAGSISAGYGYGTTKSATAREFKTPFSDVRYEKKFNRNSYLNRFYLQAAYTPRRQNYITYAFSARICGLYYPVYDYFLLEKKFPDTYSTPSVIASDTVQLRNKISALVEPAVTIKAEKKNLGLFLQLQVGVPVSPADMKNRHNLITSFKPLASVGFTWKLGATAKDTL
jgi:hypothetical protein